MSAAVLWEGTITEYSRVGSFPSGVWLRIVSVPYCVVVERAETDATGQRRWVKERKASRCGSAFGLYLESQKP